MCSYIHYSSSSSHVIGFVWKCEAPNLSNCAQSEEHGSCMAMGLSRGSRCFPRPRQTLRAFHQDQRQRQRAVDASRLSCNYERRPRTAGRWWSLKVGVCRRIPIIPWVPYHMICRRRPCTQIYLWNWGLSCAIHTWMVLSMNMGLESTDEVGGSDPK